MTNSSAKEYINIETTKIVSKRISFGKEPDKIFYR
jgi:hypothetical protein